jgi:hypothetical protein
VTELSEYVADVDQSIARRSVEAVGRIALETPDADGIIERLLQVWLWCVVCARRSCVYVHLFAPWQQAAWAVLCRRCALECPAAPPCSGRDRAASFERSRIPA